MKKFDLKKILVICIVLFLLLPFIQDKFKLFSDKKLNGSTKDIVTVPFSMTSYFNESFQIYFEHKRGQKFGLRNNLVRLNNEIGYSVFGLAKANAIVIGKNNYLFSVEYLNAYLGLDFVGDKVISEKIEKLKQIQDTLSKLGKQFVVVLNPGKASYCQEYIPDNWLKRKQAINNHLGFKNEMKTRNVIFLDFYDWFMKMKHSSPYLLYSNSGSHWNQYGEHLAADSLIHYIEKTTKKDLPDLILDSVKMRKSNNATEYEIASLMNLNSKWPTIPMPQTYYHFNSKNKTPIKTLSISDSYFNIIWNRSLVKVPFDNGDFWFYYRDFQSANSKKIKKRAQVDVHAEILKYDVILILTSDVNLTHFGYGFIEEIHGFYFGN